MALVETNELDELLVIHLNRPSKRNALVRELVKELCVVLEAAVEGAAAIVLCGRGLGFCSGQDLNEPPDGVGAASRRRALADLQNVTRLIKSFPGPVVTAVHGHALGAGCEIALAADLTVAARDAVFGFPEVSKGLGITGGISYLLPRLVGLQRAKELVLLGDWISAERALELGMIYTVVGPAEHEQAAIALAQRLIAQPRAAVRRALRTLDAGVAGSLEQALDYEILEAVAAGGAHGATP